VTSIFTEQIEVFES